MYIRLSGQELRLSVADPPWASLGKALHHLLLGVLCGRVEVLALLPGEGTGAAGKVSVQHPAPAKAVNRVEAGAVPGIQWASNKW